jgi:hypothetical protein
MDAFFEKFNLHISPIIEEETINDQLYRLEDRIGTYLSN